MIHVPRSLRVALASTAAIATIAAGVSALATSAAGAASTDATRLEIQPVYPTDNAASAGTCMIYRAVPKTALGDIASDSGTVVITLTETPNSAAQDVDFCVPPTAAAGQVVDHGYYTNSPTAGPPPANASDQVYCAGDSGAPNGQSITPPTAATCSKTPNNPDVASNADITTKPTVGTNTNPSGVDWVDDVKYTNDTPNKRWIEFGVAGLVPGSATIDACISNNDTDCSDSTDINAGQVKVTFTNGGQPDSVQAYDAVTDVVPDATQYNAVKSPYSPALIDLTLLNSSNDTVFGVTPSYRVQSGPNASGVAQGCTRSTDYGRSRCTYSGTNVGTDTLLIWVNHSAPTNGTATAGPDPGEPTATVTVTTYAAPAAAGSARTIDLTPNTPTSTTAGQSKTFTAYVTDASGTPVQGVQVTFSETGPGQISGGQSTDGVNSTLVQGTGPDGRAVITITTQPGESGTETVTASVPAATTQCGAPFNGSTGTCTDSTVNAVGGGASPSPTPSATPSGSKSPTPTATPVGAKPTLSTSTPDIQPNIQGVLDAAGLKSSATYELRCYSRPDTSYFTARTATTSAAATTLQFKILPGTNTRCYVRPQGDEANASNSVVINVHTSLSLSAYRDGVRTYHFQGTNLPRRSGQLITLYRWARSDNNGYCDPHVAAGDYSATSTDPNCVAVRTAIAKTNDSNVWRIDRSFTGSGQFVFMVKSGQNLTNAAGVSNYRLTVIH